MKAIILCAGYGKRLKPYTETYQKTMIPIHGKPLLEYIINGVNSAGFKDIIIVVGYRKEQIIDYFKNGEKMGVTIEYIEQKIMNGTGGALILCESLIKESHFFLTWGDILVPDRIYKEVCNTFKNERQDFILVTNYTDNPYKGANITCNGNYCIDIVEKPPRGAPYTNLNNSGIFIFSREIFEVLNTLQPSKRGEIEIPDALSTGLNERNWQVRILKMDQRDFRGDFGDIREYERLKEDKKWLKDLKS
ncbi:MAG: nucleotidyltransferase family protein [Promethearchaeota archaeon]